MSVDKIRTGLSNIKKHSLCLRSLDRLIGTSMPTDYTIDLGTTYTDIVMFEIQKISFPFTYHFIHEHNDQFRYTDTGPTARTLTIENGEYDIVNLLRQITKQMTDTSGETYKFELTYQNPNYNLNRKGIIRNDLGQSFSLNFSGTTNSIANILGYEDVDYTGSSIYTAPNDPNFTHISNIMVVSDALKSGSNYDNLIITNSINVSNIIWHFNKQNYSYGDTIEVEPEVAERAFRTNISSLREVDIKFVDDNGDIIDTLGYETTICITLYTKENNNNYTI